jgi:dihydrodipicolinate reductase
MGRLVGQLAVEKGDEIALTIDLDAAGRSVDELAETLQISDVAIDFSIADAVPKNAEAAVRAGVPLVVGTTGWQSQVDHVRSLVERHQGALVYGANFSVGVQVFYRLPPARLNYFAISIRTMRSSKKRIISASATRLQARQFTFTRSWVKSWALTCR